MQRSQVILIAFSLLGWGRLLMYDLPEQPFLTSKYICTVTRAHNTLTHTTTQKNNHTHPLSTHAHTQTTFVTLRRRTLLHLGVMTQARAWSNGLEVDTCQCIVWYHHQWHGIRSGRCYLCMVCVGRVSDNLHPPPFSDTHKPIHANTLTWTLYVYMSWPAVHYEENWCSIQCWWGGGATKENQC